MIRFAAMLRRLWLALPLTVTACTTPYVPARIEDPRGGTPPSFDGILSYAQRSDLRAVWIHGMCNHDADWAINRHSILAAATGLNDTPPQITRDQSGAERITFNHRVSGNDLDLRYLIWSPLARGAKSAIKLEEGDGLTRASLNEKLKFGLINDCFSDAVIYTGPAGERIKDWIRSEICDALGGAISGEQCQIHQERRSRPTVFVAESLGSKILADALLSIWRLSSGTNRALIEERLNDVQMVFLVANQIPLLNAATYGTDVPRLKSATATPEGLVDLFSATRGSGRAKTLRASPSAPLHFVAFTDPNDLLSYRLLSQSHLPAEIRISNVLVSNDKTYFGLLERPDTAHCGYGWNPTVIATIAKGYDGKSLPSVKVDVPKTCGLGD